MSLTYCFSVHAEATPSTLPRVVEVFALMGHVPDRCDAQLDRAEREEIVVDLQMAGISGREAALLAKRLGRIVGVLSVLWSASAWVSNARQ